MTTRLRVNEHPSRRQTRLGYWLLVGLAAVFATSAFTVPAIALQTAETGTIGLRLLDQPADSTQNPRAQIYIVDHLAPGAEIQRRIEVSTTNASAQVHLYAAAATITNGTFHGEPGKTPNDLSTWTSVTAADIDLMADQAATATVTITVPSNAAPGERYGVVWAEVRAPAISGGGVTQISRVGIRLYLSIGPGGPPAADFSIASLTAGRSLDGMPTVIASVTNTGGRALDITGALDLRSPSGDLHAGPYPADLGATLAIGATEPVTITTRADLPPRPMGSPDHPAQRTCRTIRRCRTHIPCSRYVPCCARHATGLRQRRSAYAQLHLFHCAAHCIRRCGDSYSAAQASAAHVGATHATVYRKAI